MDTCTGDAFYILSDVNSRNAAQMTNLGQNNYVLQF